MNYWELAFIALMSFLGGYFFAAAIYTTEYNKLNKTIERMKKEQP